MEIKFYTLCEDGSIREMADEFGGAIQFQCKPLTASQGGHGTASAYTDRLLSWDYDKHNACTMEVWGNQAQYWDDRKPADIERFITAYYGRPCRLLGKVRYTNQSSGFPVWRLDWQWLDADPAK